MLLYNGIVEIEHLNLQSKQTNKQTNKEAQRRRIEDNQITAPKTSGRPTKWVHYHE